MVVKNEEKHISEAIVSALCRFDAIIYLVDDNSVDQTLRIVRELSTRFSERIIWRRNHGVGKVAAYRSIKDLPKRDFYLFLDGDDFFSKEWSDFSDPLDLNSLYYYDLNMFYSTDKIKLMPNAEINLVDHTDLISSLTLLPKSSWVVPSNLIDEYLNIPEGVEFEDIWFSLIAYKRARKIKKIKWVWYMYRQHENQVYGSQALGGKDIVKFRFQRIVRSLEAISQERLEFSSLLLEPLRRYRILNSMSLWAILKSLGVRECLLFLFKIRCPGFLLIIKKLLRTKI